MAVPVGDFAIGETIQIRPGVRLPDWGLTRDATGQAALAASMGIAGRRSKWSGLNPLEDALWRAILNGFGQLGRAPDAAALTRLLACSRTELSNLLRGLAERDLLLLDQDEAVSAAYPFSRDRTAHRVALSGSHRRVFALCAIDALGMGGMLGVDTAIRSACPSCGVPITVRTQNFGHGIASLSPAETVVWSSRHYAGNCAATSGCRDKVFFCSAAHLESWRNAQPAADGFSLSVAAGLQIGLALFVPMLDPGLSAVG